ncbi:MOSC N-terminal beta barrel domain-containing protein [Paenibacillus sp. TAB 01]|uniref:MOSC N-terminal beta barrel domain-containing protein n=1 Tax=Paenibacillus sp. TAB 01 TaxID=3368988 RepID=UPI003752E19E
MTGLLGEVSDIYRYPVKSLAGERMEACRLEPYGLYGDRFCAFYDETKKGWGSYITARQLPELLSYKARLNQGEVNVTAPDGRRFSWDEALLAEIQRLSKREVSTDPTQGPEF